MHCIYLYHSCHRWTLLLFPLCHDFDWHVRSLSRGFAFVQLGASNCRKVNSRTHHGGWRTNPGTFHPSVFQTKNSHSQLKLTDSNVYFSSLAWEFRDSFMWAVWGFGYARGIAGARAMEQDSARVLLFALSLASGRVFHDTDSIYWRHMASHSTMPGIWRLAMIGLTGLNGLEDLFRTCSKLQRNKERTQRSCGTTRNSPRVFCVLTVVLTSLCWKGCHCISEWTLRHPTTSTRTSQTRNIYRNTLDLDSWESLGKTQWHDVMHRIGEFLQGTWAIFCIGMPWPYLCWQVTDSPNSGSHPDDTRCCPALLTSVEAWMLVFRCISFLGMHSMVLDIGCSPP